MSDPTVTAFLTKVLCSHGGRLPRDLLAGFLELPSEQIEQILRDEPQKFPVIGELVLARSPVRICAKYLKNEAEEECEKLHLCRYYLQGKCWPGKRAQCTFSHDILSDHNRTVLKANEINGLNEDEIKVLLFQNDNQLLPEVCVKYLHDKCDLGKDCSRLHICGYFTRGECNRRTCKRSHHLLEFGSDLLLTRRHIPEESIQNFQMLCTVKHNEHLQTLREEGRKDQDRRQPGAQRGRGGGRPFNRRMGAAQDGARSRSRGRQQERTGFHRNGRSASRPVSESGESHLSWSGDDDDDSDEAQKTRIMNDWINFEPNKSNDRGASMLKMAAKCSSIVQPVTSSGMYQPTQSVYTSYLGKSKANVQTMLPTTSPNVPSVQSGLSVGNSLLSSTSSTPPKASIAPVTNVGPVNPPPTSIAEPSKLVSLPTNGPSVVDSVKPVSTTVVNPSIAPVLPTRPSRLVDSPTKDPSVPHDKPVTPTTGSPYSTQQVVTKLGSSSLASPSSAPSTTPDKPQASVKPISMADLKDVYDALFLHKDVQDVATVNPSRIGHQPQTTSVSGATYLPPKKPESDKIPEICLSNLWKHCKLGGRCPDMHYYLPYRWQIFRGTNWEDISDDMEEVEKSYCDPKVDRVQSIDFLNMKSSFYRIRRLSTVSSVMKPSEYVLTTEWLWYWKDEYGNWTQYGHNNVKKVSSTILSSDLENVYLSDRTAVIPFTAGNQRYEINFQEMKQRNLLYTTEKNVRRRPKYLSFDDVKILKGSTKSSAAKSATSPLKSTASPLKTDIYPRTWDRSALPDIGCQKVPVPETSSEFSEIVNSFTKTVSGQVVKKLWRLQNPSLWQVFQWQKEQMTKVNQGRDVKEMRLFHGTDISHINAICNQNFDWRLCGSNGIVYGQGSYFARDASYSHNYSTPTSGGTRSMFVACVLVGEYTIGNPQTKRPPLRPGSSTRYYDSCVDAMMNPSIFVVFEKHQIYPEYLLEYEEQKKSCVIC
ncbi:zinc finger CCCH-type antiviral protein 1-like [Dendropsophus ebraccatus]|uniref:zinc finger CCCH-type antiviral protein 1-like n=1 Tax=Dendropsophus ebraccatus TaxID=150705 RepID=UPI00383205D7